MKLQRMTRHLMTTRWHQQRAFPRPVLAAIERAIGESERAQSAEIRFAVESALHGPHLVRNQSPRERALEVFALLRMWDTEQRNGVLIYLLLAERCVEIVVDRGVHRLVDANVWDEICRRMEAAFSAGRFEEGVVGGIRAMTPVLAAHFPAGDGPRQELPDAPVVL
jgi:uncharacterized membrane protein